MTYPKNLQPFLWKNFDLSQKPTTPFVENLDQSQKPTTPSVENMEM